MTESLRWWPGVSRRLLHQIPDQARYITLGGSVAWVATCGSVCWPPPGGIVPRGYGRCGECESSGG
ncbi:hypothetical protein [Saccharopolyspora spinosa]|uniref:Uncharacterized protein n=1 Tax=Saccharopolyspora spinosa TaxID=60894 RepID=A0A2N3Y7R4_SACSN|nr:hypothetical protein [Saccharopolyspora spinosa]PKW18903.1 hypothetical protein A8926_7041 [Saccharopolyspora spinosa]